MAFRLGRKESIEDGLRRIAIERIDHAVDQIDRDDIDRDTAVHEIRKDCKKLRGLLRLVRPHIGRTYSIENQCFRDAAAELSDIRDAEAALGSYDDLMTGFRECVDTTALAPLRRALNGYKQQRAGTVLDVEERLDAFRKRMQKARERARAWKLAADDFASVGDGIAKTYRRGRNAMDAAYENPSPENFHEWRKRAKYLWYQVRLLQSLRKPIMKKYRRRLKRLSDLLGDDHDLVVLRSLLVNEVEPRPDPQRLGLMLRLIDQRSLELRREARGLGRRIYSEKPEAFRSRLARYWRTQREHDRSSRVVRFDANTRTVGLQARPSVRIARP